MHCNADSHENKGVDHQRQTVLMLKQVLPSSTQSTVWGPVKKFCMMMLGITG